MPSGLADICPVSLGFHTVRALAHGRQSLPHRQVLPVFLCCPTGRLSKKFNKIEGLHLARPLRLLVRAKMFLRIIIGLA
jgi:hypothetical protein